MVGIWTALHMKGMLPGELLVISRNRLVSPGSVTDVKTSDNKENKKAWLKQNTNVNSIIVDCLLKEGGYILIIALILYKKSWKSIIALYALAGYMHAFWIFVQ